MHNSYLDELNASQHAAVIYNEGHSLVIAGAGSGKTRVLTYKIAYLLEHGYQPWNILALTFTNKAAREMKERIANLVGQSVAQRLWMGTFHSIFLRILRYESEYVGFSSHFTVYDASDSRSLIRHIIKEMKLDDKLYKPASVQNRISQAKNSLISPKEYSEDKELVEEDIAQRTPAIREIYQRYVVRCRQADAMDFDDLLFYIYRLFREHNEVAKKYNERFRYILVDEYQDTNHAQHEIVKLLGKGEGCRVCVVGDDAQSIYSFRGADIRNFIEFPQDFPGTQTFLTQNYRSTQTIVEAAHSLIAKNEQQIPKKKVSSEKEQGELITVSQAYSDIEEGEMVAGRIANMHRLQNEPYGGFAILYRTNAQSRIFEEALRKRNIPYRIYGGLSFYQRKEIKDITSYFRLVVNPRDEEAFKRIINYPKRGIGEATVDKIISAATNHGVSLWQVINSPDTYALNVAKATNNKLQGFRNLIKSFQDKLNIMDAATLGEQIIDKSGINEDLADLTKDEENNRRENISELLNNMHTFCNIHREEDMESPTLGLFLSEISLLTDQDTDVEDDEREKVTLTTVHAAKGLEFRTVFVVGLEDGLFPSKQAAYNKQAIEEERRLFYVAITRAELYCFLSYSRNRYRYGHPDSLPRSPFIDDIDTRYLDLSGDTRINRKPAVSVTRQVYTPVPRTDKLRPIDTKPVSPQLSHTSDGMHVGGHIEHARFGLGEVVKLEGEGDNCKATIRFEYAGTKQLLLRFAQYKVVD
ncbi:MAG: UvrD-helicase domain-containing protein [Prevotellaceae bacterium]|jgi:DNA helicase-2/ATP-dependent DNA helicase PcrA|nr:UvrD-helicase domain-containing protein [Prevotellaceae bacterium]